MIQTIEVEMPNAGAFSSCPSGDTEYAEACEFAEQAALPQGARVVKRAYRKERIIRDFAVLTVEIPDPEPQVEALVSCWKTVQHEDDDGTLWKTCVHCGTALNVMEYHRVGDCEEKR